MLSVSLLVRRLRVIIIARLFIGAFFLFYAQYIYHSSELVFYGIFKLWHAYASCFILGRDAKYFFNSCVSLSERLHGIFK